MKVPCFVLLLDIWHGSFEGHFWKYTHNDRVQHQIRKILMLLLKHFFAKFHHHYFFWLNLSFCSHQDKKHLVPTLETIFDKVLIFQLENLFDNLICCLFPHSLKPQLQQPSEFSILIFFKNILPSYSMSSSHHNSHLSFANKIQNFGKIYKVLSWHPLFQISFKIQCYQ